MPVDDLSNQDTVTKDAGADGAGGGEQGTDKGAADAGKTAADKGAADKTIAADKGGDQGKGPTDDKGGTKTIAAGGDADGDAAAKAAAEAAAKKATDNAEAIKTFRKQLAEHAGAGDKKAVEKELKRLERLGIEKPEQIYGLYRDLDNKLNGGGLIKPPGKDAKPEDVEAFRKGIGMPEKPDGFLKGIELSNGAVIGDSDKPVVNGFLEAVHKATTPQQFVNSALDWYYQKEQADAAALDKSDTDFKREAVATLKEEFGAAFDRKIAAIPSVFSQAPGGGDWGNSSSLMANLMGGRMADGRRIGDHPDMLRLLISFGEEIDPYASAMEGGVGNAKSAQARREEIRALRKTDPKKYWSDEIQSEDKRLIEAINKDKNRPKG